MVYPHKITDPYHYREFLTHLLIKKNPYYPSPSYYGNHLTRKEILKSWERTRKLIRLGLASNNLFIYIHLPFCSCHCYFCQSANIKIGKERGIIPLYLKMLYEEMPAFSQVLRGLKVTGVYFGGGTPSLMTPEEIEETLRNLKKNFQFCSRSRIIFEASPFTLDFHKLDVLKKLGVYELDLGIESFDDELLKKNARPQKMRQTIEIIRYAKKIGIPSIACDLMVGLPHQTPASAFETLALATRLPIDGIYICPFMPQKRTKFRQKEQTYSPEKILERNRIKLITDKFLHQSGYKSTLIGHRKKWTKQDQEQSYAGQEVSNLLSFGHRACSRVIGSLRYTQVLEDLLPLEKVWLMPKDLPYAKESLLYNKTLRKLEDALSHSKSAFTYSGIKMDEKKEMNVFAYTHIYNLSLEAFKKRFHADFTKIFKKELEILVAHQNLHIHKGKVVFLTEDFVSNKVIRNFFIDKEYARKIVASDKEKYDPRKNYRALIAPLAV